MPGPERIAPESVPPDRKGAVLNPRGLVVAGAGSGSGKTVSTLAILSGLLLRGHEVQPFKCGPDFIDPRYHEWIAGIPSYNLDLYFSSAPEIRETYDRLVAASSGGVVEGVMGLYDGMDRGTSTQDIARALDLPVLLVINAQGMAETISALARGLSRFREGVRTLGVIATRTGSDRHRTLLEKALSGEGLPPLVGVLPRMEELSLPERHLGLSGPKLLGKDKESDFRIALSGAAREFDWERIESVFRPMGGKPAVISGRENASETVPSFSETARERVRTLAGGVPKAGERPARSLRLGIAMDEAFWFYYPENWAVLKRYGIDFEFFSPLRDSVLPRGIDGLYLGGGYPESYLRELSENRALAGEIRSFSNDGRPVYAECGGMLYLTRGLLPDPPEEDSRPGIGPGVNASSLVGVIPAFFSMGDRLKRLGYAEVNAIPAGLFGHARGPVRGHLFHYSRIVPDSSPGAADCPPGETGPAFRHLSNDAEEGYARGNLVASYLHLFFPSNETYAESLALAMKGTR